MKQTAPESLHISFCRAVSDLIRYPRLSTRIADYVRCTGSVNDYITFVKTVWNNPEQIYPDINLQLCESLTRLEPKKNVAKKLRSIGSDLLNGKILYRGLPCQFRMRCVGSQPTRAA